MITSGGNEAKRDDADFANSGQVVRENVSGACFIDNIIFRPLIQPYFLQEMKQTMPFSALSVLHCFH
jgi:hypothetical protein